MGFIARQVVDSKRKSFAGVKLSTRPYSQPSGCIAAPDSRLRQQGFVGRLGFAHFLWKRMCASLLVLA
jgi:hypothetical protein